MGTTSIVETVFLDAQAYEAASFNFNGKLFSALRKHLASGRLRLVITDITKEEVDARIDKNLAQELAALGKAQKNARVLRSSPLPGVTAALADLDAKEVRDSLLGAFTGFLKTHKAEIIETSGQEAGPVFEKYFASKPPFGTGDKKHEFPDAFVVQALVEWASDSETELFVVSGDAPFGAACAECDALHPISDLAALLDHVASDNKKLSDFIRTQLIAHLEKIKQAAKAAFVDLGFHVDDEWGDVEVEVTSIELDGDPEILDISGDESTAQLRFNVTFDAHLSYDDSETGMWDSEEGEMIGMEHVDETVQGEDHLVVEVRAILEGLDPDEFDIDDIDLIEPARGYGIATSRMEGYPWK